MIEPANFFTTLVVKAIVAITPKCKDITRLASESLERPLPWHLRLRLKIHFLVCVWCERYVSQLEFMHRCLHKEGEHGHERADAAKLSGDAKGRLRRALEDSSKSP
jgi:hypothetical protein